jgi:hypothetical protein
MFYTIALKMSDVLPSNWWGTQHASFIAEALSNLSVQLKLFALDVQCSIHMSQLVVLF